MPDIAGLPIFAALDIDSPLFALRCADNKLMTILTKSVLALDASAQKKLRALRPPA